MNNLVKAGMTQKLFTLLFFIGVTFATQAQDKELPPNSTKYTIGEINVTGTTSYNEQTVIAFTNLKTGEQIFIPGTKISKVLNKLWDLEKVFIEGYSFGSVGQVFNIAENTGVLKNKLFNLPKFLINKNVKPTNDSLKQAISLTGFFIDKFLKKYNKKLPFYRKNILA